MTVHKEPGGYILLTAAALFTLALGLGLGAVIFLDVNAMQQAAKARAVEAAG